MSQPSELASFLRARRKAYFHDAKDFWNSHKDKLGVSLTAYSNYEAGLRSPDIDFLLRVAPLLSVEPRTMCHLFARHKMPSQETKNFFESPPGYVDVSNQPRRIDNQVYRFSVNDIPYLEKYPELYITAALIPKPFQDRSISVEDIADTLEISKKYAKELLELLVKFGIAKSSGKDMYQRLFHDISVDTKNPTFDKVRVTTYGYYYKLLMKGYSQDKNVQHLAKRSLLTFHPSEENVRILCNKLDEATSLFHKIPEQGRKTYSMMILIGDIFDPDKNLKTSPKNKKD